jgi:hypothetical protein
VGSCECSDETSGSGATELVIGILSQMFLCITHKLHKSLPMKFTTFISIICCKVSILFRAIWFSSIITT